MNVAVVDRTAKRQRPPVAARLRLGEFDRHGTTRALLNERSIEVEHGIPGELVDADVFGKRRRWGRITEIVEPSPDRVAAPCPYFHRGCGGCQWQMLDYRSQVDRKRARAEAELDALGLETRIDRVVAMADPWRYRHTAAISLGRSAGFRRRGTQSIIALDDCLISHPLIGQVMQRLNEALESERLPNYLGQVTIETRVVERNGRNALHVAIVPSPGSRHASMEAVMPIALLLARLDCVAGILYRHRQDPPQLLAGDPFGAVTIEGRLFAVSAATFFQTNMELLPHLIRDLGAGAALSGTETVVDVYGGSGILGLSLASGALRIVEIEMDGVGVEAGKRSAEMQAVANVSFIQETAEEALAQLSQADVVIVDPPRAGLSPKVVEAIGNLRPERILYVSCFAGTLARDVLDFQRFGYRSTAIRAYDFYPQTYHLELLTTLELHD